MPTLVPSSDEVRIYEIAVMIAPDLDQKSESTLLKEIDELFSEAKATTVFKDSWSKRGLAYPIQGKTEAKFVIYYVEMAPANIREVGNQLTLTKGVMRHLIVIPPKGYEAVSFEAAYTDWLKNRETVADMRKRKKEEKMQEKVLTQTKRAAAAKRAAEPKKEAKPLEMEKLSASLDKLISDDDLKI